MLTLTIRIPDDTHGRLKEIARQRGMSVNELVEELSTVAIAPYDAETRLRVMVLDKLDAAFARSTDSERGHRQQQATIELRDDHEQLTTRNTPRRLSSASTSTRRAGGRCLQRDVTMRPPGC